MRRFWVVLVLIFVAVGSASAQKKDAVVTLTEELGTLKARECEMQRQIDELSAVNEQNKVLIQQLGTMVSAYQALEGAYKTNSEAVAALTSKVDTLVASLGAPSEPAASDDNSAILSKLDEVIAALGSSDGDSANFEALAAKIEALAVALAAPKEESSELKVIAAKVEELATAVAAISAQKPEPVQRYERYDDVVEGMAVVREGVLYGYVNNKNEYVIAAQYEDARNFSEGLAAVRFNDKWGFIDKNGKQVIAFQFEAVDHFCKGIAPVKLNGKWGYVDKTGKYVVGLQFSSAYSVDPDYGFADAYKEGKNYTDWYAVYPNGNVSLLEREYD